MIVLSHVLAGMLGGVIGACALVLLMAGRDE